MPGTKVEVSSFCAPSDEDIAAFEALTPEEKRASVEAELDKGSHGEPVPLTDALKDQISARVAERLKKSDVPG